MGNEIDLDQQRLLKNIHKYDDAKVAEILAKEAEKWNKGQQRRRQLYKADRKRGAVTASLGKKREMSFAPEFTERGTTTTSSFQPDSHTVNCISNSPSMNGAPVCLSYNGAQWDMALESIGALAESDFEPVKKEKGPLERLLIDVDVPTLESLLM